MGIPQTFQPGPRLIDGSDLNRAIAAGLSAYQDGLVAHSGGGAAAATPLLIGINRVVTVAAGADSLLMPQSTPGATVNIRNDGASSATIYANPVSSLPSAVLDTLNGTAGATGIALAAGATAELRCYAPGAWVGAVSIT